MIRLKIHKKRVNMKTKSKLILGQRVGNAIYFSDEEKIMIIQDY